MRKHCQNLSKRLEYKLLDSRQPLHFAEERYHITMMHCVFSFEGERCINILAEDIIGRIINEIDSAGMYSVMADTSPDTANADRLVAVWVRWWRKSVTGKSFGDEGNNRQDWWGTGEGDLNVWNQEFQAKMNWSTNRMITRHLCPEFSNEPKNACNLWWDVAFRIFPVKDIGIVVFTSGTATSGDHMVPVCWRQLLLACLLLVVNK